MAPNKKKQNLCSQTEEEEELAQFCEGFFLEEITVEEWAEVHSSLDLELFLELSIDEALTGGTRQLRYRQTISEICPKSGILGKRFEYLSELVSWESGVSTGDIVVIRGKGDRRDQALGDLRVYLRICS